MRVLLAGGGTGGHIYPALAVAEGLQKAYSDLEILYVGTKKGLENTIVPKSGLPFATITVEGLPRKLSPAFLRAGFKAMEGGFEALRIVRQFKPDLVIGTGGYVCGPVVMAAKICHIPTVIHEQNAFPGLTNKLLSRIADLVLVNFEDAKQYFADEEKVVKTGLPIRPEVLETTKDEGLSFLGLSDQKQTLLVSGGSRGAKSINKAMAAAYPKLLQYDNLQIIHLTGTLDYQETLQDMRAGGIVAEEWPQIVIKPYLHKMEYALAAADFCVGRAGATYLAEITTCGLPAVLIPYPFASENHQMYNAKSLADLGAAVMIKDKDLSGETLYQALRPLIEDTNYRMTMAKQSSLAGNKDALNKIIALLKPYLE